MRLEDLEEKEITEEELDWLLRGSVVRRAKFGQLPLDNHRPITMMGVTDYGAP